MELAAHPVDQAVTHRQDDEDRHIVQQAHLVFVRPAAGRGQQEEQEGQEGDIG
jgi:hypothetical protein